MRTRPAGLRDGAPLTRLVDAGEALSLVSVELAAAEIRLRSLVQSDVRAVPEVAGYLVAAGGKRLRPALTALGARAVGLTPAPVGLMCVGELLHLGSLLHDDVVDDADFRRDQPAAHRVFGNAVTILTGDFCLARAVWLAAEEGGAPVARALGAVVTEMAEGEVLQLQRRGDLGTTDAQYFDVVARKSAALIAWCVRAPALVLGDLRAADALESYGRAVGVAFQITDDVLDYAQGTGKSPGADLRERKVTLPLILALGRDPVLADRLANDSSVALPWLLERVAATGALEDALGEARKHVSAAIEALEALPPSEARDALVILAQHLVGRVR